MTLEFIFITTNISSCQQSYNNQTHQYRDGSIVGLPGAYECYHSFPRSLLLSQSNLQSAEAMLY